MTGILVTSDDGSGPPGWRAVLGHGCHGLLLCHSSAVGMSPGQETAKYFHTLTGSQGSGYKEPRHYTSSFWFIVPSSWG